MEAESEQAKRHPVVLSYARAESRPAVDALQAALAGRGIDAFVDTTDIEVHEQFPETLSTAILDARLVVAFVSKTYFERWYCIREWELATAPFEAALAGGADEATATEMLRHVVLATPAANFEAVQPELPPVLRSRNAVAAAETQALAAAVEQALAGIDATIRESAAEQSVRAEVLDALRSTAPLPPANLRRRTIAPLDLPGSLNQDFVGRADELWRLRRLLGTARGDPTRTAAVTCALSGGGGYGKTRLAREYLHRFAPWYPGGLFYLDARFPDQRLRRFHEVLTALRKARGERVMDYEDYQRAEVQDPGILARDLAAQIHEVPPADQVLWVVDNLPERDTPPLADWCAAPGRVTTLVTTRARSVKGVQTGNHLPLDVLTRPEASRLLRREVDGACTDEEIAGVTGWVGRLPLALEILNAALRTGITTWPKLVEQVAGGAAGLAVTDARLDLLRDHLEEDALRGVAATFELTLQHLEPEALDAAEQLACLSPAPLPEALVDAVCESTGDEALARSRLVTTSLLARVRGDGDEAAGPRWEMHTLLAEYMLGRRDDEPRDSGHAEPEPAARPVVSATRSFLSALATAERSAIPDWIPALDRLVVRSSSMLAAADGNATLHELARALEQKSRLWGNMDLARAALGSYRVLLEHADADEVRAALRCDIGDVHQVLGELSGSADELRAAVAAYEAALRVYTEAGQPAAWAGTQNNLGSARQVLGQFSGSADELRAAVAAYEAALRVRTEAGQPAAWAMTQNNLGNARSILGQLSGSADELRAAVAAYEAALRVRTEAGQPADWAMTQNNLGNARSILGELSGSADELRAAVAAYEAALRVCTEAGQPAAWAMTQNNLGNARQALGELSGSADELRSAVAAYEAALRVYTEAGQPADWAMTQNNLGNARQVLGKLSGSADELRAAVAAYEAALRVRTEAGQPADWAMTQNNLGSARQVLGQLSGSADELRAAVAAHEAALRVQTEAGQPAAWAGTQNNLGAARQALGELSGSADELRAAVAAYEAALRVYTEAGQPAAWASTQNNLGVAQQALGQLSGSADELRSAVAAYEAALRVYTEAGQPADWASTQNNLERCRRLLEDM